MGIGSAGIDTIFNLISATSFIHYMRKVLQTHLTIPL